MPTESDLDQIPGLFALVGDSADNVKGVGGVGIKLGAKLMQEYDTVQEIVHAARGLSENVAGMSSKERKALGFDAKVLRGLLLVKAYLEELESSRSGRPDPNLEERAAKLEETASISLDVLESVHRMVTDVPLQHDFERKDTEVGFGGGAREGAPIEGTLAVPRLLSPAFGEMLHGHGFASIFKMFPLGMVEPPALQESFTEAKTDGEDAATPADCSDGEDEGTLVARGARTRRTKPRGQLTSQYEEEIWTK